MDNKAFDRDEGNVVNNNKQMQVIEPVRLIMTRTISVKWIGSGTF